MSVEQLDDEVRNIGKTAPAVNKFSGAPMAPTKKPKKGRGPGRPRKQQKEALEPPVVMHMESPDGVDMTKIPGETDINDPDDPRALEEGMLPPHEVPEELFGTIDERIAACLKIEQLSKRLGAVGTGLKPNPHQHPLALLEDEIALMNSQIGGLHAERLIKLFATQFAAPLILAVYNGVASSVSSEPPLDLSLFPQEVNENWDAVFGDAAAQIAINNPISFGKKAPYMSMIEGVLVCAASAAEKKLRRDAAAAAQSSNETVG